MMMILFLISEKNRIFIYLNQKIITDDLKIIVKKSSVVYITAVLYFKSDETNVGALEFFITK